MAENNTSSLNLQDPIGPSVWDAASQHKDNIPATEWEYSMRKSLNDAAFTSLSYTPACTHMPVCPPGKCSAPKFVWDDKHMQHGQLLLALHQAPTSLERLVAVGKLCVTFLSDLLRRSDETQAIPLLILGHHYLSHRVLSDPMNPAAPATQPVAAAAAAGPTSAPQASTQPGVSAAQAPAVAAAEVEGDVSRVYVQELCTFDAQEGPKTYVDMQGVPQATCAFRLDPIAVAKSKRLGRELSIKVTLQPSTGSSSTVRVLGCGEDYTISWPALLFMEPISIACTLAYKGDLVISCPQSSLFMTLSFAKDHSVKGTIEQLKLSSTTTPQDASNAAAAAMANNPLSGSSNGGGGSSSKSTNGPMKPQVIGSVQGSWMGALQITCPHLGLEGLMYDTKALNPAPVPSVDLRHMGLMKVSRFWSAVHDALLYADPRAASGGRSAVKLAATMGHYLSALTLDSAAARDVGLTGPGSSMAYGSSKAPSVTSAATDPDLEEFDRQAEGVISGKADASQDTRAVPPCYKEQHASGHKLSYQLHYTLALGTP